MLKRGLDILLSLVGIIIFSPIMVFICIAIAINMGTPILFTQERVGKDNEVFKIYKFRTMRDAYDEKGNLLSDHERLTKLGLWLRKTSLDELPELYNILKGEMSLVGPRPLLVEYLLEYDEYQIRYLVVILLRVVTRCMLFAKIIQNYKTGK